MKTKLLVQLRKEAASRFRIERDSKVKYEYLWKYFKDDDKWRVITVYNTDESTPEGIQQDIFCKVNEEFRSIADRLLNDRKHNIKYPW